MNRREFLAASTAMALVPTIGWAAPDIRLKAAPLTARILPEGDGLTRMLGFNGSTPGPELRARQGTGCPFPSRTDPASTPPSTGTAFISTTPWTGCRV